MNGYELSRQWFSYAFENPSTVKPVHGIIYFWNIELANRLGWPKEFASPASQAMAACGIHSYNTYKKALTELHEMGFIQVVKPSINQYQSCIVALSKNDNPLYKALDNALLQHSTKHMQSTVQSTDSINKPETNKPVNQETNKQAVDSNSLENIFEKFRAKYPGSKRGLKTELDNLKKKHADYRVIIPTLPDILEKQKEYREQRKKAGAFVPEWPMLSTYINQKRWEMDVSHSQDLPQQPHQTMKMPSIQAQILKQKAMK